MGKKLDKKIEESALSGKGGQVVGVNGEVFDWDLTGKIQNLLVKAISSEFGEGILGEIPVLVTVPTDTQWGDYTSNIGMQLAGKLKQSPLEIANKLQYRINEYIEKDKNYDILDSVSVALPGYINFKISSTWLNNLLNILVPSSSVYRISDLNLKNSFLAGKRIMIEYTDPNPFKIFHIGHLMPNAVGESLSRIFEFCGADVKRASYQGDVGMHVAKAIYGMILSLDLGEDTADTPRMSLETLSTLPLDERIEFLGKCYTLGAISYEDEKNIPLIQKINALIYVASQEMLKTEFNWDSEINFKELLGGESALESNLKYEEIYTLYATGRAWSLEYFESIYKILGTKFDYYYFESIAGEFGYKLVSEFLNLSSTPAASKVGQSVFEKDNGAVVFKGEPYGLHTRVFINSKGLPTYEAKDLGLPFLKQKDYDYTDSYIVTASEQSAYFEVVFKALELINPDLAEKTHHVAHGMLNLTTGKMSSRTGDVVSVDELLSQLSNSAYDKMGENSSVGGEEEKLGISQKIAVAALKYAILRQQLGKDITYDRENSLQLQGDTGPYLLYSYVRAFSVLEKASKMGIVVGEISLDDIQAFSAEELALIKYMAHFNEVVLKSAEERLPSHICTYLHDLASKFNTFYASSQILDDSSTGHARIYLTKAFLVILHNGLNLLGISAVERM